MAWSREQAQWLKAGRFDRLDLEHLADEIEDVGKSEQRELANRMAVLLTHLLKWQFQPGRRGSSWQRTIVEQRRGIEKRLRRTPSLCAIQGRSDSAPFSESTHHPWTTTPVTNSCSRIPTWSPICCAVSCGKIG